MDAYDAIQTLARIALGSRNAAASVANDDDGLSAEALADTRR